MRAGCGKAREVFEVSGETMKNNDVWYLLFGGSSQDGRGTGTYFGRTTDQNAAREHYDSLVTNPFSIGRVEVVTDERIVGAARGRMTFDAALKAAEVEKSRP